MRKTAFISSLLLGAIVLPLSGCGFTPMHAPSGFAGAQSANLSQVRIEVSDGKDENDKEAGRRLGISADDVASRYDGSVRADYKLIEAKTGNVLDRGRISATSTFGASRDAYGVIASNDAAMRNTAEEAADRLIIQLATYFSTAEKLAE